jgi:hypothetical protein
LGQSDKHCDQRDANAASADSADKLNPSASKLEGCRSSLGDESQSEKSVESAAPRGGLDEKPSFIDTFASVEDLVRFQSTRAKSLVEVLRSQLALARKAIMVSIVLLVAAGFVAFGLWIIVNVAIVMFLLATGVSTALVMLVIGIINALLLLWIIRELRSAIEHVNLNQFLDILTAKESTK